MVLEKELRAIKVSRASITAEIELVNLNHEDEVLILKDELAVNSEILSSLQ